MSDKKVKVPDGMMDAFDTEARKASTIRKCLEASLQWLMDNPIVPTTEQASELSLSFRKNEDVIVPLSRYCAVEWQRRMFLAPEVEYSDHISDLLYPGWNNLTEKTHNLNVIESFSRGQKAASK